MSPTATTSDSELLAAGMAGDERAWEQIVARYQPLIDAIARRHRIPAGDEHDVSQHVWMQLVNQGGRLREPRALPGWIATTATRRCYEVLRVTKRAVSVDPETFGQHGSEPVWASLGAAAEVDDGLLRTEQRQLVRRALAELNQTQQQLLLLLVADPPVAYREIGERMGLPVGSIGPTRARLLKKLGRSIALQEAAATKTAGFTRAA